MGIFEKLKVWYMNLSIKYKMIIFFYGMIIIISTVLGVYSYKLSSNNIQTEISNTSLMDIEQISASIKSMQDDITDLSTTTILSKEFQSILKSKDPYSNENIKTCERMIDNFLISKNAISFIAVYGENGYEYYSSADGSSNINNFENIKSNILYKSISALKGRPLWASLINNNQIFIINNKFSKVAMCRSIYDTNSLNKLGVIVVCINVPYIERTYMDGMIKDDRKLLLLDSNNKLIDSGSLNATDQISGDDLDKIVNNIKGDSGKYIMPLQKKETLVCYSSIENSNWKLVYLIPKSEFSRNINNILSITLIIIISCLVVSFIISMYVSNSLTSPIKNLVKVMKNVNKDEIRRKVNFKYNDEIGILGNEYNNMIDNISDLIEKVYMLQIKEKEAELKALQAQINPHFLYNTLDTIFWRAEKAKEKDISEMIYALSKLFRLTLNNGAETTFVRAEKEFIEYYLLLQKNRYKDKLTYNIEIEEEILDYKIPKLILQPFVENAIIYGTENDAGKSIICITGAYKNGKIYFSIEDNGMGMSKEQIQKILSKEANVKENGRISGYAIYNINQRLALYYNNDYSLLINSEIGIGTNVQIIIPTEIERFEWGN